MFPTAKDANNSSTANKVDRNAEALKNKARDIAQDAEEGVHDLRDAASRAGRKVRNAFDSVSHEFGEVTENVGRQIRNRPVQSSVIALGAGVILGLLLRR